MMEGIGGEGTTILHRLPAGTKLAALAVGATALFLVDRPAVLAIAAAAGLLAARSTGRGFAAIFRDLFGALAVIAAIGAIDLALVDARTAAAVALRLAALAFLAHAVTLTTTVAELSDTFERGLAPFGRLGLVDANRAALTITLALRFVPLIAEEAREIREAQAARGLSGNMLALAVPLVVRVLVRAEEVADAIDARGFPPADRTDRRRTGDPLPHDHA